MPKLRTLRRFTAVILAAALLAAALAARATLPDPVRFGVVVENGDINTVRGWLDEGLSPEFVGDRIGTGLMIAAWEGNVPMMELFLSRGANVNRPNANGEQALMFAAWRGHLEATRWLLERGAQLNRSGLQWTALHYAVFAGHEKVAQLLIERGANVNARSTNGSTPLMMAAREGRQGLADMLLGLGANASLTNDHGDDAFVWAMRNGHPQIAKTLGSPERFAAAVRELRRTQTAAAAARQDVPKALEIRARRGEPGREQAVILYEGGRAQNLFSGHPSLPAPGGKATTVP
jgi:ankyrin repeat protein